MKKRAVSFFNWMEKNYYLSFNGYIPIRGSNPYQTGSSVGDLYDEYCKIKKLRK